jgi:hypothetical protein
MPLATSTPSDVVLRETVFSTDVAVAGVGGMRNIGLGS